MDASAALGMIQLVKYLMYKLNKLTSPTPKQQAKHGDILCDPRWVLRQADHGGSAREVEIDRHWPPAGSAL